MLCPACGSVLKEHTTKKGVLFLVCGRYPTCKVSATPELIACYEAAQRKACDRDVDKIGTLTTPLARLRILQSQLNQAETDDERATIRAEARNLLKRSVGR